MGRFGEFANDFQVQTINMHIEVGLQEERSAAGVVQVDTVQGLAQEDLRALLAHYTIHADGTHPHVHGANLGIRADAYIDAGGWTAIPVAEDHCLWSRIRARGWPTLACSKTVVHTSGRLQGRAVGGFADTLRRRLEVFQAEDAMPCTP